MGKALSEISDDHAAWIAQQHVFFVATAPDGPGGHVNLSPKGLDSFRVLGPRSVAYLDLTGSGVETIAHLRQNGRITIMFCAFEGRPRILRLYGTGTVVRPGAGAFDELRSYFPDTPGIRSVISIDVTSVGTSCGFGVPELTFAAERDELVGWAERKAEGDGGIEGYWATRNATSIDGLPGLD